MPNSFSFNVSGADKADALAQSAAMIEQAASDNALPEAITAALEGNAAAQVALLPDDDPRRICVSVNALWDGAAWVGFEVKAGLLGS
ncbi:hypothetical protein [Novosphingobium sp. KACC 22771]|uniref:hypothetical protein n=1 Tax=Novosphingobium sp. KACC 22771 TaxID=3025670 RepID=UPI0023671F60|nr:hypothetical protein [Novosphingobium sp. KACC 22771]WDF71482.1 hypothetical protein PQ467_11760 [Novosphingobium sp. KACC 22771]